MKIEEVIEYLSDLKIMVLNKDPDLIDKAMPVMFDALEHLVPKTPFLWGDGYSCGELVIDMYNCPFCEKSYELESERYDYCPNCGQAIDWSEVE